MTSYKLDTSVGIISLFIMIILFANKWLIMLLNKENLKTHQAEGLLAVPEGQTELVPGMQQPQQRAQVPGEGGGELGELS